MAGLTACDSRGVDPAAGSSGPTDATDDSVVVQLLRVPIAVEPFTLTDLEGRTLSSADWKGKVVLVNFWATWCPPCLAEIPDLIALQNRYRDRLVVVGISVDRGAPRNLLDPYVTNLKLTFPILLDSALETAGKWRVTALPATFIVKPGGEVAGFAVGPREWNSADMTALLETMLPGHRPGH